MSVVIDGVADIHWWARCRSRPVAGWARASRRRRRSSTGSTTEPTAALQASPMGDRLYRRMGFVELYRYEEFLVFAT
jgi:hypothetical protein